jgi:hypothetical protein
MLYKGDNAYQGRQAGKRQENNKQEGIMKTRVKRIKEKVETGEQISLFAKRTNEKDETSELVFVLSPSRFGTPKGFREIGCGVLEEIKGWGAKIAFDVEEGSFPSGDYVADIDESGLAFISPIVN